MRRLVLLGLGLGLLASRFTPGHWRRVPLARAGVTARVREPRRGPYVLVLQGYSLRQEFVQDPALELYRRGFTSVTLDINEAAHPPEAVREILEQLPGPVGIYAHSGSVTPSAQAAGSAANVAGVVLLGFHPGLPRALPRPRNVCLIFGQFDDYIPVSDMLSALADCGGPPPTRPFQQTGQFSDGSARLLWLSPLSNHGGEPFDPRVQEQGARWLGEATGWAPGPASWLPLGVGHWGWLLLGLAGPPAWLIGLVTLISPLGALVMGGVVFLRGRPRLLLFHVAAFTLACQLAGLSLRAFAPSWARALLLYELVYLPSQADGRIFLPHALGALALMAALTRLPANDWLPRWQLTCARGWPFLGMLAGFYDPALAVLAGSYAFLTFLRARPGATPRASSAPRPTAPDSADPAP